MSVLLNRAQLAKVFPNDPQVQIAFEAALQGIQGTPDAIAAVANDASTANGRATAALTAANAIKAAPILTFGATAALTNDRVLGGGTGVTVDLSVAGLATILVNVAAALGYVPGFKGVPQNPQPNAYAFQASDVGKHVFHNEATARVYTIPAGVFVAGDQFDVVNWFGAGAITLTPAGGVTLNWFPSGSLGGRTLAANSRATLLCIGADNFALTGVGIS